MSLSTCQEKTGKKPIFAGRKSAEDKVGKSHPNSHPPKFGLSLGEERKFGFFFLRGRLGRLNSALKPNKDHSVPSSTASFPGKRKWGLCFAKTQFQKYRVGEI